MNLSDNVTDVIHIIFYGCGMVVVKKKRINKCFCMNIYFYFNR